MDPVMKGELPEIVQVNKNASRGIMVHGQSISHLTSKIQPPDATIQLIKLADQNIKQIPLNERKALHAFYVDYAGAGNVEINLSVLKRLNRIFLKEGGPEILKKVLTLTDPHKLLQALATEDYTSQPSLNPEILEMALAAKDSAAILQILCSSPDMFSLKTEIFDKILTSSHPLKVLAHLPNPLTDMSECIHFWNTTPLEECFKIIDFVAKGEESVILNVMSRIYSSPQLSEMPLDIWDRILGSKDSLAVLDCFVKHPKLYLAGEGGMPPKLLDEVLKKGFRVLQTLLLHPQLWKNGPTDMPTEILPKILHLEISGSEAANILESLSENPYLWQAGVNGMPSSYLNQILDLKGFYRIHTALMKCQNPLLWQTENGWKNHPLFSRDVNELIKFIDRHADASEIVKGLELLNLRLQPVGKLEPEVVFNKALIAHKAIKLVFEDGNGMNQRFELKKEEIIAFLTESKSEDLEVILKAGKLNLRQFIKAFLSQFFVAQENKILEKINDDMSNRADLVQHLEELRPSSYATKKLIAQARVWAEMGQNEKLKDFPFRQIWRFVIDGSCEAKGAYFFEDEPGYIIASLDALLLALQSKEPPSLKQYGELHDVAVRNVLNTKDRSDNNALKHFIPFEAGFAKKIFSYGVKGLDSDIEGLEDLKARGSGMPFEYNPELNKVSGINILEEPRNRLHVEATCQRLMEFIENKPPAMRLMAYLWLARELELMHILPDANGRSTMILLYQLVANDPDIPMIMFHNPNVLDANGPEKLLCRILENMEKFKHDGAWDKEGRQQDDASLSLAELELRDAEILRFRDRCLKEVPQKSWKEFHALIAGNN